MSEFPVLYFSDAAAFSVSHEKISLHFYHVRMKKRKKKTDSINKQMIQHKENHK